MTGCICFWIWTFQSPHTNGGLWEENLRSMSIFLNMTASRLGATLPGWKQWWTCLLLQRPWWFQCLWIVKWAGFTTSPALWSYIISPRPSSCRRKSKVHASDLFFFEAWLQISVPTYFEGSRIRKRKQFLLDVKLNQVLWNSLFGEDKLGSVWVWRFLSWSRLSNFCPLVGGSGPSGARASCSSMKMSSEVELCLVLVTDGSISF